MRAGRRSTAVMLTLALAAVSGCVRQQRRTQLENVAKGWCETIRASQVIPVYPLTEDLRPGDVFLVQRSVAEQAEEWKKRGFLALDDQRARLGRRVDGVGGVDYTRMYFDGYWKDRYGAGLPHDYASLDEGNLAPGEGETEGDVAMSKLSRAEAPRVGFPAYSFDVSSSGGGSLAVPVHGVPVALSFMKTGHATGVMTIGDAYTYSADPDELHDLLEVWAADPKRVRKLNAVLDQVGGAPVYLRVVTRVYLTGAVAVSLTNQESGGGRVAAGVAPETPVAEATDADSLARMKTVLAMLDSQANVKIPTTDKGVILPGGAVKFAWANGRSVALNQAFDRPLVVGYLGFDVRLGRDGQIGAPIPTWMVLKDGVAPTSALMGKLTPSEQRTGVDLAALESLVNSPQKRGQGLKVMAETGEKLGTAEFISIAQASRGAMALSEEEPLKAATASAFARFKVEAMAYTAGNSKNARDFDEAFQAAFANRTNR